MQEDGSTALTESCKRGHADIVKQLLAVPGVDVNLSDVSCVLGRRLRAVISRHHVRSLRASGVAGWLGVVQGDPGGGLRGRRAVAGVAVCRWMDPLR